MNQNHTYKLTKIFHTLINQYFFLTALEITKELVEKVVKNH